MAFTTKFYTADTHFGHQLMLADTACARPFPYVRAMDEALRNAEVVFEEGA